MNFVSKWKGEKMIIFNRKKYFDNEWQKTTVSCSIFHFFGDIVKNEILASRDHKTRNLKHCWFVMQTQVSLFHEISKLNPKGNKKILSQKMQEKTQKVFYKERWKEMLLIGQGLKKFNHGFLIYNLLKLVMVNIFGMEKGELLKFCRYFCPSLYISFYYDYYFCCCNFFSFFFPCFILENTELAI